MNKIVHNIIFTCLGLLVVSLLFLAFYLSKVALQPLQEAQKRYVEGVHARNALQRNEAFNKALNVYSSLEDQYHPMNGNGKLYNNIAETYFQLEQYPWAALYFYRAKALMPRDEEIDQNLQIALSKLDISAKSPDSTFKKVFFFHYYLSLPERLQILSLLISALLGLASLYLWKHYRALKGMIAAFLLVASLFLGSVLYTKYFEPLEGVIVKASMLHRDTNIQSALVTQKPLMGGYKVEILDVLEGGRWLKIRTSDGTLGYMESDSLRLLY